MRFQISVKVLESITESNLIMHFIICNKHKLTGLLPKFPIKYRYYLSMHTGSSFVAFFVSPLPSRGGTINCSHAFSLCIRQGLLMQNTVKLCEWHNSVSTEAGSLI